MGSLLDLLGDAIDACEGIEVDPGALGWAVSARAEVQARMGNAQEAIDHVEYAVELARRAKDRELQAYCHYRLSFVMRLTGRFDSAMAAGLRSREIAQTLRNLPVEALAMNHIGCIQYELGDHDAAIRSFRAGANAAHQIGHYLVGAMSLGNIGLILLDQGELDEAETTVQEAMIDADRIDNRRGQGTNFCRLARVAHERGELGRAQALYSRAVSTLAGVGDRTTTAYAEGVWGLYELEHGDRKVAMVRLKDAAMTLEDIEKNPAKAGATVIPLDDVRALLEAEAGEASG